ncbi:MAG: transpeptidase family protein [Deltaproteobacteria bacterium]|jgi:cell division protein FtsI (penicillin-binding protein 3)|nr:transpeptidase family protein [Deltaproteobacteria bacterium]
MKELEKGVSIRIRLMAGLFIVAFLLIGLRAFELQVMQEQEWDERAERQHQKTIPLTPQRGTIFDCNGEELAVSVDVDSIYAEPRRIADKTLASERLSKALNTSSKSLQAKFARNSNFVWLKRQVNPRQSEQVRSLDLEGIGSIKEHRRFYPNSSLAAHLVGFTGLDPKGLEGIELAYDKVILGRGGYLVMERDALGRGMVSGDPHVEGATPGHDLYLTVDKNLQYIAERELTKGIKEAQAKSGTVIAIEPSTGRVLAMASYPEYNPNAINRHKPNDWRNRAICDTFEPGSTFKIFLMAAALNEAVLSTDQLFYCENGSYRVGGKIVHDHKPYKYLTPAQIIKYSSNIGSAKIGKLLERETYYKYISDFGFGRKTGIDLPGETIGLVRTPDKWFEIDLAAISFGQGISVTPLQLASATAAIANEGYLMEPFVVERVIDGHGHAVLKKQPKVIRKVISRDVAHLITRMMERTTEEGGTATNAKVPGYRVAGKTGTAQKVDPITGSYSSDKRVASFVGFAPVESPRIVVLVVVDEPQKGIYGGLTAAPIFSNIVSQAMQYLKVAPNQPLPKNEALPPLRQTTVKVSEPISYPQNFDGEESKAGPRMPNFHGLSYRQVLEQMARLDLNVSFSGHGRVIEQSPAPGVAIPYGAKIWVRMMPPS